MEIHNLSLPAGGVAFFCFLAITPLIAAIVLIYGLVADVGTVEQQVVALTRVPARCRLGAQGAITPGLDHERDGHRHRPNSRAFALNLWRDVCRQRIDRGAKCH